MPPVIRRHNSSNLLVDMFSHAEGAQGVLEQQLYVNSMVAQQNYHDNDEDHEGKLNLFRRVRDGSVEDVRQYMQVEEMPQDRRSDHDHLLEGAQGKRRRPEEAGSESGSKRRRVLLQDRGRVGEIPLHMACLYNRPAIAIELIRQHQQLGIPVHAPFEQNGKSPFEGENCLHIAVAQSSHEIVDVLLSGPDRKALLSGRATGSFFRPPQDETGVPTVEDGWHYFGESPLAFAAAMGKPDMCDKLLGDRRADPAMALEVELNQIRSRDQHGNTLVHLCLIHDRRHMLDHLWRWHREDVLWCLKQRNNELVDGGGQLRGLTPLMKAVRIGNAEMVHWIELRQRAVLWKFGDTICEQVPLDDIDPVLKVNDVDSFQHECRWSLLNDIDKYSHKELLHDDSLAWRLIEYKWSKFASGLFYMRFLRTLAALSTFALSLALDNFDIPAPHNIYRTLCAIGLSLSDAASCLHDGVVSAPNYEQAPTFTVIILAASQAVVLFLASSKLWIEVNEWRLCGTRSYWKVHGARFLENFISVTASSFILSAHMIHAAIAELSSDVSAHMWVVRTLLALGSISAWSYLFFFLLGCKQTGKFVVMLWDMLLKDITSYLFVFLVFLVAFAQGLYMLLDSKRRAEGILPLLKDLTHAMLGDTDDLYSMARVVGDEAEGGKSSATARLLTFFVCIYILVATLMMFNTLVAAMNDTYTQCSENAVLRWKLERARIIASLESEMNAASQTQDGYWVTRDGRDGAKNRVLIETRQVHDDADSTFACTCERCKAVTQAN